MNASRRKECKGYESETQPAGVFLLGRRDTAAWFVSSEIVVFLTAEPEFVRCAPFPPLILS